MTSRAGPGAAGLDEIALAGGTMAWRAGVSRRVTAIAAVALTVTVAVLVIALTQRMLAAALLAMGVLVVVITASGVAAVRRWEHAEQGFRRLFESAPDATLAVSPDGIIVMANTQAGLMFGYPPGQLAGRPVEALVPAAARASHAAHRASYSADPHARPMGAGLQLSAVRRDGTEFPVEISLNGLPAGQSPLVIATARDISERLDLEAEREQLRAEAERERNQRRIQQAQKLESLGQLVGGIAHDFNNLLNIITGYTEFAAEEIVALAATDHRLRSVAADIGQVGDAAQQATRLTRQLLTFARHDVIKPEVLNLNDAVHGVQQLLQRTIGEHIDLAIVPGSDLWPVRADRGQFEQILVNLAINARDAMPGGGKLTIDTGNADVDEVYATTRPGLEPGRYVRLRVSDTGIGMDSDTLARVFEPFFTTKPKGHGTGLGLATVYGIITQSGGTIQIYSEPGLGTTISALLPATIDAGGCETAGTPPAAMDLKGHGETILLVEDEESLRDLAHRILTQNGYQVRQATSAPHAVYLASNPAMLIDLLLTDIVMPDMLGTQVAEQIRDQRPDLPVLFMSGYAQPILHTHGAARTDMDILEKPFTKAALLTRVHRALHTPQPAAPLPGPRP